MRKWIACWFGAGRLAALVVALLPLAGCGDKSFADISADERAISELVDAWNELKYDPKAVVQCFAKGSAPPKDRLKELRRYTIAMTGRPSISGTSVILPIQVSAIVRKEQQIATLDWTFEKEGDAWKIKAAPLP